MPRTRTASHRSTWQWRIGSPNWPNFLSLRNDGSIKEIYSDPVVAQFEKHLGGYNMLTQQLLWLLTDVVGLSDSDFEINLHLFDQQILEIRREWSAARRAREAKFRALNPNYDGPDPREI